MGIDSANPASGSESTTVADPVSLISGLLEREDNPAPTPRPRNQKPEPEPEPEEAPEPGPEVPPTEEDGDESDDEQPSDQARLAEDQTEPEAEQAEPELFTVKIDGKEQQVTREELLNGYQRDADYRRKTMDLSQSRQAVEAEAQRIAAERQHYQQQLDTVASVLQATLPAPPPREMRDSDPIGYQNAKEDYEERREQLRQVLAERDRAAALTAEQQEAARQQMLRQARDHLLTELPEWKDPAKAEKGQREVVQHLRVIGYSDAEIAQSADPRAIVMARESMLYRQLVASKPAVQQKLATAPKMVKPGSAGPAPDQAKAIINKVRRSGGKDIDAIARLIELG